jgi:hypothetical protein
MERNGREVGRYRVLLELEERRKKRRRRDAVRRRASE